MGGACSIHGSISACRVYENTSCRRKQILISDVLKTRNGLNQLRILQYEAVIMIMNVPISNEKNN
jgi:hypothetical protein